MSVLALVCAGAFAQNGPGTAEVDYANPSDYIVGGVKIEGNTYLGRDQIMQLSGLRLGEKVTIPGDQASNIVNRLWQQRYFKDVSIAIDSLSSARDTVWLAIKIVERPRVSQWSYSGVKTAERKEIQERVNLRRGGSFSDYVQKTTEDIIKRYFREKGFEEVKVSTQVKQDTIVKNAIKVNFAVDRGPKVRIRDINFTGTAGDITEYKLAKSMKKTKSHKIYNFFHSKKFSEKEYPEDKKNLIAAFNEAGYRDARLVKDSVYYVSPGKLGIDLQVDPGKKYYFRNITWTGNSVWDEIGRAHV